MENFDIREEYKLRAHWDAISFGPFQNRTGVEAVETWSLPFHPTGVILFMLLEHRIVFCVILLPKNPL